MAYLNANIPATYAQIRREYLYDLKKHHGEVEDCIIFGMASITGRAILFHAIMENGAVFYRLPISAFIQRGFRPEDVPKRRLDELQLWNCFSYYPSVHIWDLLGGTAGKYAVHFNKKYIGVYRPLKEAYFVWNAAAREWNETHADPFEKYALFPSTPGDEAR